MSSINITPEQEIGGIVRELPPAARVFETHGIDYCCNGGRSLASAAEAQGLDSDELIAVLESLSSDRPEAEESWEIPDLIEHIESEHHDYLRAELPSLGQLVTKVKSVHLDAHPELREVQETFDDLADEMVTHIRAEENETFPIIHRLHAGDDLTATEVGRLREEIADLESDHEQAAGLLDRLETLTDGFAVPDGACPTYENMLERLRALKRDTHQHVHKENNILFHDVADRLPAGRGDSNVPSAG